MKSLLATCVFSFLLTLTVSVSAGEPFLVGADFSHVGFFESRGVKYRENGEAADPFQILKRHGMNYIRLRIFTATDEQAQRDPYNFGSTEGEILTQAKRAKAAGLAVMLDFHFSDTWADGGTQRKPAAWEGLTFPELEETVQAYTRGVITRFKDAGVMPEYVQLGNETRPGMICPDGQITLQSGETRETHGEFNTPAQWEKFGCLLNAAARGVREASGDAPPRMIVHFDLGGDWEKCRWFFENVERQNVDFDILGLSYYPWWHGTLADLRNCLTKMTERFEKPVMLVEIGFPWDPRDSAGQPLSGIPPGPDGQVRFLREIKEIIRALPSGRVQGMLWWGAEYQHVPGVNLGGFDLRSFWDADGNLLPVADEMAK